MTLRIGSLFTGYGGLDAAVEAVTGGRTVWVSDNDPGAAKILAHNQPGTPNLGDITGIDWAAVEPVDILTGGFPCQDISLAGLRGGMAGARSGLWTHMATAIDVLRPALVVAENVRGLLSAEANSDVEPCPWCVGDGPAFDVRALGAVLADLADLGYDAAWHGLAAADVGACHERFRVFVAAWPAEDTDRAARGQRGQPAPGQAEGGRARADPGRRGGAPAADADGARREGHRPVRPDPPEHVGAATHHGDPPPAGRERGTAPPGGTGRGAAADSAGVGRVQGRPEPAGQLRRPDAAQRGDAAVAEVDWGAFGPAIRRWEAVTGRAAPAPTGTGVRGGQSLAPAFVEFLMGLPAGHVTGVPGLSRNEQLKALGNGVVPQQAEAALRYLLSAAEPTAAA